MWGRLRDHIAANWAFWRLITDHLSVCLAIAVTGMMLILLRFPTVAAREKVSVLDLLLRSLENGNQHRLTEILTRRNPLGTDLVPFDDRTGLREFEYIRTTRIGRFAFNHEVKAKTMSNSVQVTSTTPNLQTGVGELKQARSLMETVFHNPVARLEVAAWGRSLIAGAQATTFKGKLLPETSPLAQPIPGSAEESEAEALYAAAVVFRGHQPNADTDLPRLVEMGRTAYPNPAAARRWAAALLDRWDEIFNKFQQDNAKSDIKSTRAVLAMSAIAPPRSEWTEWWVVYQFIGLDDPSRDAALNRWQAKFPVAERHAECEAFGHDLIAARTAAGEPIPPAGPATPWVALLEYYRGWDAQGARIRALFGNRGRILYGGVVLLAAYPGDDLYMIALAGDPLELLGPSTQGWDAFGFLILLALMLSRGYRILILSLIGKRLLRLGAVKQFQDYVAGRAEGRWWVRWSLTFVIGLFAWQATLANLGPPLSPIVGSERDILIACLVATAIAGAVFTAFTRFTAVMLIYFRVDIQRVWFDEYIGLVAAGLFMWHFGNGGGVIALYALAEVVTTLLAVRMRVPRIPTAKIVSPHKEASAT